MYLKLWYVLLSLVDIFEVVFCTVGGGGYI